MEAIELTLDTPEGNLALDEALLLAAGESRRPIEYLRLWEAPRPLVVVGRSSRVADEVNVAACEEIGAAVLRRSTGGAAIVAGPGCLMYAVVLSLQARPRLRSLDEAHRTVLETLLGAIAPHAPGVARRGTSDLTLGELKFSGNSLRVKRTHLLYHGTLLYDFDLPLIGRLLKTAPRQPTYRAGRPHEEFVTNVPLSREALRDAILKAWSAEKEIGSVPLGIVAELVSEKYTQREWNYSQ